MAKTKKSLKHAFAARAKYLDLEQGDNLEIVINNEDAGQHGITSMDMVSVFFRDQEIVVGVIVSDKFVKSGEVGLLKDVVSKYKIPKDEILAITYTDSSSESVEAIKKGLQGGRLNQKEIHAIIRDISDNRFPDILTSYYSAMGFFYPTQDQEMYWMAKAMGETGEMLKFKGIVADKHCMGGVPGNETTMIMIPLLASLGINMPKSFSKAITTPAATGECVSVLMDISFTKKQIQQIVKKENCCLVRGGGLSLAPADEKLIKVAYPLSMQSYSRTIVSIMAKKYAMGINHLLLDIPVGPTAKVPDTKTGKWLAQKYQYVGKKLGIKVHVELTQALQPIGAGIGAVMQVREVLRVLQQHPDRPMDLQKKAIYLSAKLIELVGMAKGAKALEIAQNQLVSGKARSKMQSIIKTQNGKNPKINSEDLELAKISKQIKAEKNGTVKSIDMKTLNSVARTLGAPIDLQSGLYLSKKVGSKVKKGDIIYTLYTNDQSKINLALKLLDQKKMYEIK